MGNKWKRQQDVVCMYGTVNCAGTDGPLDAQAICDSHNADCDAYEARIAELEEERDAAVEFAHATERAFCTANTELARVKAESLRVVRVKSENEINFGAFVRHIFLDGKFVRLERWEEQG